MLVVSEPRRRNAGRRSPTGGRNESRDDSETQPSPRPGPHQPPLRVGAQSVQPVDRVLGQVANGDDQRGVVPHVSLAQFFHLQVVEEPGVLVGLNDVRVDAAENDVIRQSLLTPLAEQLAHRWLTGWYMRQKPVGEVKQVDSPPPFPFPFPSPPPFHFP